MRMIRLWIVFTSIFLMAAPLFGQDMRAASKKAKVEYEAARAEARVAKERDVAISERGLTLLANEPSTKNQHV